IIQLKVSLQFFHYQYAYAAKSFQEMLEIQIRNLLSSDYLEDYKAENPLHLMKCTN
ncbi:hypothetical protein BgiMline_006329, partial [Biomphalaria glabrata]